MARLNEVYKKEIAVKLKEELNLVNVMEAVSYTHLRAHETKANLVCRLLLEKKKKNKKKKKKKKH